MLHVPTQFCSCRASVSDKILRKNQPEAEARNFKRFYFRSTRSGSGWTFSPRFSKGSDKGNFNLQESNTKKINFQLCYQVARLNRKHGLQKGCSMNRILRQRHHLSIYSVNLHKRFLYLNFKELWKANVVT